MQSLKNLKSSTLSAHHRYMIMGVEGVGKSTLASGANKPLWLDVEDGAGQIDVARVPFPEGHATKFSQVLEALDAVLTQEHDFKTLVIDTVDRLEALLWQHCCENSDKYVDKKSTGMTIHTIEGFGYGKGYIVALSLWRELACKLDMIRRKRKMTIILIAHTHIKSFRNPEGDDFDRYIPRLNEKAGSFLKSWCDVVAFMRFDEGSSKLMGEQRAKGYNTGRRFVYTRRRAAFDAKSRLPLDEEIEIKGADSWVYLTGATGTAKEIESNPF